MSLPAGPARGLAWFSQSEPTKRTSAMRELYPSQLTGPGHYVHWGVVQISVANLTVVVLMVVVFVLALVLPFPKGRSKR
jgi:hypothetical protein